jgi:hypothetical protein
MKYIKLFEDFEKIQRTLPKESLDFQAKIEKVIRAYLPKFYKKIETDYDGSIYITIAANYYVESDGEMPQLVKFIVTNNLTSLLKVGKLQISTISGNIDLEFFDVENENKSSIITALGKFCNNYISTLRKFNNADKLPKSNIFDYTKIL